MVIVAKIVGFMSRFMGMGAGATWPGEIALRFNPDTLSSLIGGFQKGIILVAGTNGKTTTTSMIKTILEAQGLRVVHNASGANLLNGIVSACIQSANWSGKIDADYGIFEVDENSLPFVVSSVTYQVSSKKLIIVLLNLFRDQLDRYGEVDVIAEKWKSSLLSQGSQDRNTRKTNAIHIIANADDPLIAHLGKVVGSRPGLERKVANRFGAQKKYAQAQGRALRVKVMTFGIDEPRKFQKKMEHATDSTFCLNCGMRLVYDGVYYSHIGVWYCPKCGEKRPRPDISDWKSPLPGLYNQYNTLAAVSVAKVLHVKDKDIETSLATFQPAFGRQEEFEINGKNVKIFLSKNPAGLNQSLRTVLELGVKDLLLVLNDRIPDGRDVSWIWDVDFEMIPKNVSVRVSGDRVYDLALRLKYAGLKTEIFENLEEALIGPLYVLPTYSAMLEVRKILKGKKIL